MKRSFHSAGVLISGLALHGAAAAHTFAPPYTLPVPFTFYAFGAAAALVLSFVIVGLFATTPSLALIHRPAVVAPTSPTAQPVTAGQQR